MSEFSGRDSLSARVARALEREIFAGQTAPGARLAGTRELAKRFKVSQRVVLSALNRLEAKDVLVRLERRGVFVKERAAAAGAREVLFFAFGERVGADTITRMVNDLILRRGRECRYDFFSRIVNTGGPATPGRLDRELARLANLGFIDCALFYMFPDMEEAAKCMTLPYPVIFLGEKPDGGKVPEGFRLLSPDSGGLLRRTAEYAIAHRCTEVVFACYAGAAAHDYERTAMDEMAAMLDRARIPLRIEPFAGDSTDEAKQRFDAAASELGKSFRRGGMIAVQNLHSDCFDDRELFPREAFPDLMELTLTNPARPGQVKYIRRDYAVFQQALTDMIDRLRDPGAPRFAKAETIREVVEENSL